MSHAKARLLRACGGSRGRIGLICVISAVGEDASPATRCDLINSGETVPGI